MEIWRWIEVLRLPRVCLCEGGKTGHEGEMGLADLSMSEKVYMYILSHTPRSLIYLPFKSFPFVLALLFYL